jgi:hypothetical protein
MNFNLEYLRPGLRFMGVQKKSFNDIKTLTQFVRRKNLKEYIIKHGEEPVMFLGNKMVSLSRAKQMVAMLEAGLSSER